MYKKKKQSDHFVILFFSILTLIFNIYLLYLKCIPKYPDKIILILTLLMTLVLVICIPFKVLKYKDKEVDPLMKEILNLVHWGYFILIPIGILLAKSVPLIVLMICVTWFALIGRAIYHECPLTAISERSSIIDVKVEIINLFYATCVIIGSIRLLIN